MSIYKPNLLDKFKDFVNGLKSNWDAYEGHVEDFETAKGIITDTFDETRTYAVGDYAIYENVLYKCVEAIEEAGEWDADKWAATNIAEEFKSHQAENASKHITESGSNDDGYYIKFDDGTMICHHNRGLTGLPIGQTVGSIYCNWLPYNYPVAFIQTPTVYCSAGFGDGTWASVVGGVNTNEIRCMVQFMSATSRSSVQGNVHLIAIGRWK